MKKLSDCITEIEEIRPLPNGNTFAAKVKYFYVETLEGRRKIDISSPEFYGSTEEEAEDKAKKYIKDWLDTNNIQYGYLFKK